MHATLAPNLAYLDLINLRILSEEETLWNCSLRKVNVIFSWRVSPARILVQRRHSNPGSYVDWIAGYNGWSVSWICRSLQVKSGIIPLNMLHRFLPNPYIKLMITFPSHSKLY